MSVYQSEMKVPIRPAPPPPVNPNASHKPLVTWNGSVKVSHNKVSSAPKKKPPPRPPPPKFPNSKQEKKHIPARPSQLITSLFHKRNNTTKIGEQVTKSNSEVTDTKGNNVLSLIDFNSPPSSPTFTTRSSSDALSVNSFGSDGVTPCSTSSGNTSNVESSLEDDFDLFLRSTKRHDNQVRDPWSVDPGARSKNQSPLQVQKPINNKNASWVIFPNSNNQRKNVNDVSAMPTIIRVKPDRPKPPIQEKVTNGVQSSNVNVLAEIFKNSGKTVNQGVSSLFPDDREEEDDDDDDDDDWSSESPPMPTCPPPAPPLEVLDSLIQDAHIVREFGEIRPYGVALYDFTGEHPNDLSFKEGDVIHLVRRIDDNWLVGELNGLEGTVPANFIRIGKPLPEEEDAFSDRHVTALYSFRPETWDDLEFEEGSVIELLGRINQDWLYGQFNGRTGQFPANFVDRVPPHLPFCKK